MKLRYRKPRQRYTYYINENGEKIKEPIEVSPWASYDLFNTSLQATDAMYDDRMRQWDWAKYRACCTAVWGREVQCFIGKESEDVEKFISLYLGKPVTLTRVSANKDFHGYEIYCFHYIE